jgi:hypothetical protein
LYLSKGDRLTLIKSTLSSLPNFFLSLFKILPKWKIDWKIYSRISYGVGWTWSSNSVGGLETCFVLPSKLENRVLGMSKISIFNQVLLGKWLFPFVEERNHLWRCVIWVNHGFAVVHWTADYCIIEIDNIKSNRCNIFADNTSWLY